MTSNQKDLVNGLLYPAVSQSDATSAVQKRPAEIQYPAQLPPAVRSVDAISGGGQQAHLTAQPSSVLDLVRQHSTMAVPTLPRAVNVARQGVPSVASAATPTAQYQPHTQPAMRAQPGVQTRLEGKTTDLSLVSTLPVGM